MSLIVEDMFWTPANCFAGIRLNSEPDRRRIVDGSYYLMGGGAASADPSTVNQFLKL